jgi:hypothetical protein
VAADWSAKPEPVSVWHVAAVSVARTCSAPGLSSGVCVAPDGWAAGPKDDAPHGLLLDADLGAAGAGESVSR